MAAGCQQPAHNAPAGDGDPGQTRRPPFRSPGCRRAASRLPSLLPGPGTIPGGPAGNDSGHSLHRSMPVHLGGERGHGPETEHGRPGGQGRGEGGGGPEKGGLHGLSAQTQHLLQLHPPQRCALDQHAAHDHFLPHPSRPPDDAGRSDHRGHPGQLQLGPGVPPTPLRRRLHPGQLPGQPEGRGHRPGG